MILEQLQVMQVQEVWEKVNVQTILEMLVVEVALEAFQNAGVHLADAAFGQVQRVADLLHGHFFEVIQDDDQALGPAQAAREPFLYVLALEVLGPF